MQSKLFNLINSFTIIIQFKIEKPNNLLLLTEKAKKFDYINLNVVFVMEKFLLNIFDWNILVDTPISLANEFINCIYPEVDKENLNDYQFYDEFEKIKSVNPTFSNFFNINEFNNTFVKPNDGLSKLNNMEKERFKSLLHEKDNLIRDFTNLYKLIHFEFELYKQHDSFIWTIACLKVLTKVRKFKEREQLFNQLLEEYTSYSTIEAEIEFCYKRINTYLGNNLIFEENEADVETEDEGNGLGYKNNYKASTFYETTNNQNLLNIQEKEDMIIQADDIEFNTCLEKSENSSKIEKKEGKLFKKLELKNIVNNRDFNTIDKETEKENEIELEKLEINKNLFSTPKINDDLLISSTNSEMKIKSSILYMNTISTNNTTVKNQLKEYSNSNSNYNFNSCNNEYKSNDMETNFNNPLTQCMPNINCFNYTKTAKYENAKFSYFGIKEKIEEESIIYDSNLESSKFNSEEEFSKMERKMRSSKVLRLQKNYSEKNNINNHSIRYKKMQNSLTSNLAIKKKNLKPKNSQKLLHKVESCSSFFSENKSQSSQKMSLNSNSEIKFARMKRLINKVRKIEINK